MKEHLLPAIGIIVVTVVGVVINEFTELTFVEDYALVLIVSAMLLGVWLARISGK